MFVLFHSQLDVWRGPTDVATPVDIRVPFHSLKSVKAYLEARDVQYTIMIKDLQVRRGSPNT